MMMGQNKIKPYQPFFLHLSRNDKTEIYPYKVFLNRFDYIPEIKYAIQYPKNR